MVVQGTSGEVQRWIDRVRIQCHNNLEFLRTHQHIHPLTWLHPQFLQKSRISLQGGDAGIHGKVIHPFKRSLHVRQGLHLELEVSALQRGLQKGEGV